MECWKPCYEFEDLYEVSDRGRVRRADAGGKGARPGLVLKPAKKRTNGYLQVILRKDGRSYTRLVHRLVLLSFLGPPKAPRAQAAHFDGSRDNNALSNLRWATPAQNNYDQLRHGTARGKGWRAQITERDVIEIRCSPESSREIARRYGMSARTITQIRRRQTWKHVPRHPDEIDSWNHMTMTPDRVRAIRSDPRPMREIAEAYGISYASVQGIKARRIWRNVPDEEGSDAPRNPLRP